MAQKLADEAKAQEEREKAIKSGATPAALDDEGRERKEREEEEEEEEREREKEKREKEKRENEKEEEEKKEQEKVEKEKKEMETREEKKKNDKEKKEKRLLKMEQEGGKLAVEVVAGRVVQEASGPSPSSSDETDEVEEDYFDDEDVEEYQTLYDRHSGDTEYDDDPFYGRPWSTEVPKVSEALWCA